MPSIHPQHKATSSACASVTVGRPELFLGILSQSSVSRAWFAFIHAANAASVRKLLIFRKSGTTGAMDSPHPAEARTCSVDVYSNSVILPAILNGAHDARQDIL